MNNTDNNVEFASLSRMNKQVKILTVNHHLASVLDFVLSKYFTTRFLLVPQHQNRLEFSVVPKQLNPVREINTHS